MLNKRFTTRVAAFIAGRKLLDRGGTYIVALSGGADSVTLALVLRQLGYQVEAAHCNFRLRGEESDRDEEFCRLFCAENNIELHVVHFDTKEFARLHKISIEMAARKLRYAYFEQLRKDIGAADICVAHHGDDTVETVLMNLIRGTGIHGLTGIAPRNGHIVRPLLCVFRHEIETVLNEAGQSYVTDSTNLEDDVVRNKIRLNLLPMMRQINPSVSESISATAERISDAAKVFDAVIETAVGRVSERFDDGSATVLLDALSRETAPEYVLFSILKDYSFTPSQVMTVFRSLHSESGREFTSSTHQLLVDRGKLIIEPLEAKPLSPMKVPEPGTYVVGGTLRLRFEVVSADIFKLDKSPLCACLDASRVLFPLTVRTAKQGDRFIPFGMKGSKLVSDYLTDRKKTLFEKRRQLVIEDASGRIAWLVAERPDNRFRLTDKTRRVLIMTLEDCRQV